MSFINHINGDQYNFIVNKRDNLLGLIIANFECKVERDNNPFTKEDSKYHPALNVC